jgi:hypothetical protein
MIRLEQENEQQAHILKQAETLAKTLQAQLAEQTAKYTSHAASRIRRDSSRASSAMARFWVESCSSRSCRSRERITTYLADVQASTEATLCQRELDLQLKQDQLESAFAKLEAKEKGSWPEPWPIWLPSESRQAPQLGERLFLLER